MSTSVEKTGQKQYTDLSGTFYENMKYENLKNSTSIFVNNPGQVFRDIDEDKNGELSKPEITNELYRDIERLNTRMKDTAKQGIMIGFLSWINSKSSRKFCKAMGRIGLCITLLDLGIALHDKFKINELNQRIANGHN